MQHLRKYDLLPSDLNQEVLDPIFMPFKPCFKPSMIQGNRRWWSRWDGVFFIWGICYLSSRHDESRFGS